MTVYRHRMVGPGSAGDVWVCTMHSQGGADLATAHNAWAFFVSSTVGGTLHTMWATETSCTEVITDQLDPLTWKNQAQAVTAINIVGTDVGQQVSPRDCLVVGLRTALPTRAGRGRMFLPSPSAAHYQANGKLNDAACTTIAGEFAAAITGMRATIAPIIAHRTSKTWDVINRVTVGDIPGVQRRRTNKDVNNYSSAPA